MPAAGPWQAVAYDTSNNSIGEIICKRAVVGRCRLPRADPRCSALNFRT